MKHLSLVKESYLKHLLEAWLIVGTLLFSAFVCLIHSFIPVLFQSTASNKLKWILNRTNSRRGSN